MAPAHTQGRFSVNIEGGSLITREDFPSTQRDIADSDTSVGGVGNSASAGYTVSITNATLSALAWDTEFQKASINCPDSVRPLRSVIVTDTMMGMRR